MISYWKKMMKGKVFLICLTLSVAIVAYMIYSASFYRKLSNGDYLFGVFAVALFTFMLRLLARVSGLDKFELWQNVIQKASSQKGLNDYLNSPQERRFSFHGDEIVISRSYDVYNSILNAFRQMAKYTAEAYLEIYEYYDGITGFLKHGYDDGQTLIKKTVLESVNHVLSGTFRLFNENVLYLYDRYSEKYPVFESSCREISNKCSSISEPQRQRASYRDTQLEYNRAYREARKESRGRWIGYGFGLTGAIKATIQANVLNSTSAIAHEVYNSFGNAFDSALSGSISAFDAAVSGIKKERIYSNQNTKNMLYNSIFNQVFTFHYVLWVLLLKHDKVEDIPILYEASSKQEEVIKSDIQNAPKDSVQRMFVEALLLNPYDKELYRKMFRFVGFNDPELREIAKYFEVDL